MGQACSSGCSDGETSKNNYDIFEEIADGGVQKTVAFDKNISDEMDSMLDAPLTSFDTEETDTNLSDLDNDSSSPVAPAKSAAIVATTSSTTPEEKETTTTTTAKAKSQKRKTKKNSTKKKKSGKQGRRGNKHKSKKQNAAGRKTYSEALLG